MRALKILPTLLPFVLVLAAYGASACSDTDDDSTPSSSASGGTSGASGGTGGASGKTGGGSNGSDAGQGDAPDANTEDSGGGLTCNDENSEPNDTAPQAHALGSIDDCDENGKSLTSAVSGAGDTDFYSYAGTDVTGCLVDPTAQVDVAGLEVCVFAKCNAGTTSLVNCLGGTPAPGVPDTTVGCCTLQAAAVTTRFECSGGDDAATVSMSVRQATGSRAGVCTSYKLDYHY